MFPNLKIRTNMDYKYQDGEITCGDDLLNNNNGIYGQIEVIDEIQSWYSSLQSKNFPPHLIEEICQQRKHFFIFHQIMNNGKSFTSTLKTTIKPKSIPCKFVRITVK